IRRRRTSSRWGRSSRWCGGLHRSDRSAWSCGFLSFCLFLEAISPPRAVQTNGGIHDQVLDDAAEVVVSCVACQFISGPEDLRLGADVPTLGSASLSHVRFPLLHVESTAATRSPDRWWFEIKKVPVTMMATTKRLRIIA